MELTGKEVISGEADELGGSSLPTTEGGAVVSVFGVFEEEEPGIEVVGLCGVAWLGREGD